MTSSKTQLRQLQELQGSIPAVNDGGMRIVIVRPDDWPADVQAAYRTAKDADDMERMYQIIEAQTGQRASRTPEALIINMRRYPGGPK